MHDRFGGKLLPVSYAEQYFLEQYLCTLLVLNLTKESQPSMRCIKSSGERAEAAPGTVTGC